MPLRPTFQPFISTLSVGGSKSSIFGILSRLSARRLYYISNTPNFDKPKKKNTSIYFVTFLSRSSHFISTELQAASSGSGTEFLLLVTVSPLLEWSRVAVTWILVCSYPPAYLAGVHRYVPGEPPLLARPPPGRVDRRNARENRDVLLHGERGWREYK